MLIFNPYILGSRPHGPDSHLLYLLQLSILGPESLKTRLECFYLVRAHRLIVVSLLEAGHHRLKWFRGKGDMY